MLRGRKYQEHLSFKGWLEIRKVGNRSNGFGIHQYIKRGTKSKQNLNDNLFNNMLRGRKY